MGGHEFQSPRNPVAHVQVDQVDAVAKGFKGDIDVSDECGVLTLWLHRTAQCTLCIVGSTWCYHDELGKAQLPHRHVNGQVTPPMCIVGMPLPPHPCLGIDATAIVDVVLNGTACVSHGPQRLPIFGTSFENCSSTFTEIQLQGLLDKAFRDDTTGRDRPHELVLQQVLCTYMSAPQHCRTRCTLEAISLRNPKRCAICTFGCQQSATSHICDELVDTFLHDHFADFAQLVHLPHLCLVKSSGTWAQLSECSQCSITRAHIR